MSLTTAGAVFLAQAAINDTPTFFSSGVNAHLGVGDSNAAFATNQVDLQAATNKFRKVATVTRASGVLTFVATFATGEANYVWHEVGGFNGPTGTQGETMLFRKVEVPNLGEKVNTQTWTLTTTVTFSAT